MDTTIEARTELAPHLLVDCFGCSKDKLADREFISRTLRALPELIGQEAVLPPSVFIYSGLSPEESGVSGVVLTADSHITVHTFPEKKHAFIDIFSWREFDTARACNELVGIFEANDHQAVRLSQGKDLPKTPRRETARRHRVYH